MTKATGIALFLVIVLLQLTIRQQIEDSQPVMRSMAVDQGNDPTLLQLAGWLARYGLEVVATDDAPVWRSAYPERGSSPMWFKWRVETMTMANGGEFAELRILTQPEHRDSLCVWTAVIDSAGVQGDWSIVGRW